MIKKNKLMEKTQKGGMGEIGYNEIKMLFMQLFVIGCHIAIFVCLFMYKNLFNIVFSMFITLLVVSFFTCMFNLFILPNPLGKFFMDAFTGIIVMPEWTRKNIIHLAIASVLFISQILQFISTTLLVTVFNSRRPPTNTFKLTIQNSDNLFMYEFLYIFTFLFSVLYYVIMMFIGNLTTDNNMMYGLAVVASILLLFLVGITFYYAYSIYYNVIIKKNQLYQGVSNTIITIGPTGSPDIEETPSLKPTLPVCTKPVNTSSAYQPPDDGCS